ncbi:MAG: M20/M25/M40 family metallo-hydrolase [Dehalococcoidales bacterium]|nr:M20/M25/M40 family metallo-hydrolase [Dehalococcoidales bacterium]
MKNPEKRYAKELASMIKYPTIAGVSGSDRVFHRFRKKMTSFFPHILEKCDILDFDGSFLIKLKGSKNTHLPSLIMSHHDVVEAYGDWKYPPFSGTIADGRVWGRGAIDNKAMFWGMMRAVDDFIAEGHVPESDLYIVTTCDEEIAGSGAKLIAKYLKDSGFELRFVLDEGGKIVTDLMPGLAGRYAMLGVTEKRICDVRFTARGAGGHASVPSKNTPLARLASFVSEVESNDIYDIKLSDTEKEMLRRMAPNMSKDILDIFADPDKNEKKVIEILSERNPSFIAMAKTTVAFTMAHGSNASNVIPTEAYVIANMRLSKHATKEENIKKIADVAKKYDIDAEVVKDVLDVPVTDYRSKEYLFVEDVVRKIFPGVIPVPVVMNGGTDAHNFCKICKNVVRFTPVIVTPEQEKTEHGIDEYIEIAALPKIHDFITEMLYHL